MDMGDAAQKSAPAGRLDGATDEFSVLGDCHWFNVGLMEDILRLEGVDGESMCNFFFSSVLTEMQPVSERFERLAREIVHESMHGPSIACSLKSLVDKSQRQSKRRSALLCRANALIEYAGRNAQALRAELKAWDERAGDTRGAEFLAACERSGVKWTAFLNSHYLHELRAVIGSTLDSLHGPLPPLPPGEYGEYACGVCLDLLHEPIALGCGHAFCKGCTLTCGGLEHWQTTSNIPKDKQCPLCRRDGVLHRAKPLLAVQRLLESRFPRSCKRRSAQQRAETMKSAPQVINARSMVYHLDKAEEADRQADIMSGSSPPSRTSFGDALRGRASEMLMLV